MKRYSTALLLLGCMTTGVLGFLLTRTRPFGLVFDLSLILIVLGLIGFLAYVAYSWYKKSRLKKVVAVLLGLLAVLITAITIVGIIDLRLLMPAVAFQTLDQREWKEDFDYLDQALQKHPAYNDSLGNILTEIRSRFEMSTPDDHQTMRSVMTMVSHFNDGHSNAMPFQLYLKTRYLPIQINIFEDGVYITASRHKELVGGRIISINGKQIDQLLDAITPLIGADNPYYAEHQATLYVPNLDVLKILDNSTSSSEADIKIMVNGKEFNKTLASVSMQRWLFWSLAPNDDWRPVGFNLRNEKNRLEKKNDTLLYMTFNQTGPEDLLTEFGNRLKNNSDYKNTEHLIIDLRNNTGGDNTSYNELIKALADSKIDLTLFTGRKTFSAGINFISELKLKRNFRIIGEPTGAGHNHYGDAEFHFLPNSGIMLSISTRHWEFIPGNKENAIFPDHWIRYKSSDYFNQIDPWMNALDGNLK